jgi:hypothetical protein
MPFILRGPFFFEFNELSCIFTFFYTFVFYNSLNTVIMEIQISVQNPQRAIALLEFLKSFDLIDTFKVLENAVSSNKIPKKDVSFFDQFYGKTNSGLTINEIDEQLKTLRQEWERDI